MTELQRMRSTAGAPADKMELVATALGSGADVLMVDLELVPERRARGRANLPILFEGAGPPLPTFVRVANPQAPDVLAADLAAAVLPGLVGVIIPECDHPDQVQDVARRLTALERERGLTNESIGILPLPETALAIHRYFDTLSASPRVVAAWFPSAENGDLARDVGYRWSLAGAELLYMRSKIVVDARAVGIEHILDSGLKTLAPEDFEHDTIVSRDLGYTGRLAFDERQTEIANRIYSPSEADLLAAAEEIRAWREAEAAQLGVVIHNGKIIDITTVKHAERLLSRAGREQSGESIVRR